MQFTNLFDDDRAVSPVIGVILMVAITVILAAVIGTFVLGMSDQMGDNTPRASFGFDTEHLDSTDDTVDRVTISHESGQTINGANLKIGISSDSSSPYDWPNSNDVSAGTSITVVDGEADTTGDVPVSNADIGGETLRVIYDSPDSDSTTTLQKFQVPN